MSKFEKVKVSLFAFITTLSIISIFSCEIGLGAAVDTEAPNINITVPNPESVAVIRDSFPIMGNWSDDGEIESIKVVITSNSSNQQFTKNAEFTTPAKGETGGSWTVFFEPEAEGILDGAYSVNITIEDTAGHSTETSSQIRIDNTPPLIVLQRPSTILSDNSFDPYGKTFSLIGQSTDENGVTLMKLNFYHNSDLSDTPTEIELSKVPDTINFDIARFELNKQNAYYNIYESTTPNGTKEAYFNLTAYDGAQKYEPNGTQTAEDTFGNPATVYYLYDDISELITSYKVTGLYKILAGTYGASEAGRSAGQSSTVLNQLQQKQVSAGKFSLNPANTPTYTLSGGDRLELPSPNISECGEFFATGNHDNIVLSLGSSIQFNVIPGLDGVSLLENTLIPYAIEYPEPAGGENKLEIEVLSRKQSSTSDGTTVYKIEGLISESNGFETNKCYRIVLEGQDKEGIGVEPDGNGYGFYCRKVGDGPKLEITVPEEINVDKKAGDTVTITGNVEYTENGLLKILLNKIGEDPETLFTFDTTPGTLPAGITRDNVVSTKYYYTYTIPANKFTQNTSDKYKVEVQATGDEITVSKTRSVVYDVTVPEATIFAPEPIAHKYSNAGVQQTGDYLNKVIKIKANVKDTGGSDVDLENTHLQYNSTNGTSGWRDYTAAEILKGTNTYSVDTDPESLTGLTNGNVYFRVNVKDNSGNEGNSAVIGPYIVDQDTDKPVILPGKDWMEFYATSNADFSDNFTRNLLQVKKVYFKLIDDDDNGLQSVSVKVYKADGSEITDTAVTSVKDFSAGKKECTCYFETKNLDEGKYRVEVTASDNNNAEAVKETWINITAAAPRLSNISIDNKYVTTNGDSIAPATATEPFANAKKKIKASFKINSTSAPFKLTYKITAADGTLIKDFDAENSATELTAANYDSSTQLWSYEITPETSWTAGNKKAFKLQLKVFDKNHNEGLQNTPLDFYIDNSQPVVTANTGVATPTAAETEGNSWDFDISASDTDGDSAYPAKYFIAFANKADDVSGTISNRTDWFDATSLKSYPLTYTNLPAVFGTADAPNSGKKVVYVKVQDFVGNISEEFSKEFNYDKGDPTVAITGYTIDSEATAITENEFFAKGLFTLSASAEDDWAIDSLELTETKDGTATTASPKAVKLVGGVLKKADGSDLTLPSTGLVTAVYKYTLKATDKAEKSASSSEISVQIDQSAPELTLNAISTAPLNGLVAFSGNASDAGLGLKSLLHKIVADGSEDPADSSLNASELSATLSTSWRLSVETLAGKPETGTNAITWDAAAGKYTLYEGKYKLYARAKDKADNVSVNANSIGYEAVSSFTVDYAKPEVASAKLIVGSDEAAITGSGLNYFKADSSSTVKVRFIVKETNGLSENEVKINNIIQPIPTPDADGNYTFEYTIPAASYTGANANKAIDIKVDLKDIADRDNSVTYKIYNDTEKPEISIDNPGRDVSGTSSIAGASFIFSATVKDKANGSGLKEGKFNYIFTKDELTNEAEIKAAATGTNGTAATPGSTGNWTIKKDIISGITEEDGKLCEGIWHLYIYAEDAEGNAETSVRNFCIDQANPVISNVTSLNSIYGPGSFTLSGNATDTHGIKEIKIKDNGTDTGLDTTLPAGKDFARTFYAGSGTTPEGQYKLTEGLHTIELTVTDNADKSTKEVYEFTVDITAPTGTVTPAAAVVTLDSKGWYASEYVGLTVTTNDLNGAGTGNGTGVSKVEVAASDTEANASWTELSESQTTPGEYSGSVYCAAQGENTIRVRITDKANNKGSTTTTVYVDTEEPDTLEITKIEVDGQERTVTGLTDILVNGSETSGITIRARAVDANASATDKASGIAKVTLTKPVDTAIEVTTEEDSTNAPGVYLITIPTEDFKSGPIVLTATDKVGKVKTLNTGLKITLDNIPPEVKKINVPSAVNGKLALSGTVYDNRSAFKSVDVFYYVDSNVTGYKKWVSCYHDVYAAATDTTDEHKPSANWKLEKTVAEDGTVTDTRLDTAAFTSAGVTDSTKIYILTVVYDEAGKCNIALDATGLPSMTPAQITASTDKIVKDSIEEITLNQDGDRPEITLNGLNISSMSTSNLVKLSESSVSGRITDDDGVAELYYRVDDGTNWLPITLAQAASTNTTFTWTEPAEGTYNGEDEKPTIKFKVVDTEGGEFITKANTTPLNRTPKFANGPTGSDAADLSTEGLYLIIDRTPPAVRNIGIKTSATATEYSGDITGTTVGGDSDHNKFWLQLEAYDINGIQSVTAKLTGGEGFTPVTRTFNAGTPNANNFVPYTIASSFDVDGYESGTYTLLIKVDDGTKPTERSYTIKVDNDAPLVQVNNHEADELISSAFNLKGDIRGSDDGTKLWYSVTKSTTVPTVWTSSENTAGEVVGIGTGKWSVSFDDGTTDETSTHSLSPKELILALTTSPALEKNAGGAIVYAASEGANAGTVYRTTENYYFHFLVKDKYGNENSSYYQCRIDPTGDIPVVRRTETDDEVNGWVTSTGTWYVSNDNNWGLAKDAPAPAGYDKSYPAALMSGVARISGTASAQNGIKAIYMQVDPSFNGISFNDNWADETLPNTIKINNTPTSVTIKDNYSDLKLDYERMGNSNLYGIRIASGQTWSFAFNKQSEFENTGNEKNIIAIRLYVVDKNNNISLTDDDDLFVIRLDSGAPKIGSSIPLVLRQYSDNDNGTGTVTKEIRYEKNMWVKGIWWIYGSVEDANGISSLIIDGNTLVQRNSTTNEIETVANANGSAESKTWSATNTSGFTFKYKVGSKDPNSSSLSYVVTVLDTDSNPTYATETIVIKYDNKPPTLVTEGSNYNIPVNVKNSYGFYSLQASAKENSNESGFLRAVFYFKRNLTGLNYVYDSYLKKSNAANQLAYADLIEGDEGLYWKEISISSSGVNGSTVNITAEDANIHKGGLAKLKGVYYRIDNVSGTEVTLDESLDELSIASSDKLYVAIGHVVDHEGSETPSTSTDIEKSQEAYYGYYKTLTDDDGDRMIESVSPGTETIWSASINSNNIPDGEIEIHYVVFDAAGNPAHGVVKSEGETKVVVGNNAPRLAGLKVTSGAISETFYYEQHSRKINGVYEARATDLTTKLIVSGNKKDAENGGTAFMTAKDQIEFIPEIVGGNGALSYTYNVSHTKSDNTIKTLTGSSPDTWSAAGFDDGIDEEADSDGYYKISGKETYYEAHPIEPILFGIAEMTSLEKNSKEGSPTWFNYTLSDSTAGGSLNVEFQCALNIKYFDDEPPTIDVDDLYWNSEKDNSLYQNSRENGHIELKADLTVALKTSPYGGVRDKVSGKITMRGTASDNIRVKELWVKPIAGLFATDKKIATYDGTNWISESTDMAANNWTCTVKNEQDDVNGHKVNWTFSWDTSKITDTAKAGVVFEIYAKDEMRGGKQNDSTKDADGNAVTPTTYTVDVVPYITDVETSLSSIQSTNPSVYSRTALGHYPVYIVTNAKNAADKKGETITYKGFNLGANPTYTVTTTSTSGEYDVTVNEIKSINNKNDDTKPYNKCPNNENNDKLTDNVFLDVWQFNSQAAVPQNGKIDQAVMKINPVDSRIGFAFVNGSFWTSMANGKNGGNSYETWMMSKDFCSSTYFAYDKQGYTYGVMAGGDSGNMADKYNFVTSRWGISSTSNGESSRNGSNALRMEELCDNTYSDKQFEKQRFVSSSLVTSLHGSVTNVYLAYYDALYNQIRFRYGSLNSNSETVFDNFQDACTEKDKWSSYATARQYTQLLSSSGYPKKADGTFVEPVHAKGKPGPHVSLGVISAQGTIAEGEKADDVVVAVWYSTEERTLWYSYNTDPTTSRANTTRVDGSTNTDGWSDPVRVFAADTTEEYAGEYCKVAVDAKNGVHIAAYDSANTNVVYAYLPALKKGIATQQSDFSTCLVDGNAPSGEYLTLDVALATENSAKGTPYIGYYSQGCTRPKMAYAINDSTLAGTDSNDKMTGNWEITVVPTPKKVETQSNQHNPINVAVWKTNNHTNMGNNVDTTYGVLKNSKTGDLSATTANGNCWGNGTNNPVLGYVITDDTIETAQKK